MAQRASIPPVETPASPPPGHNSRRSLGLLLWGTIEAPRRTRSPTLVLAAWAAGVAVLAGFVPSTDAQLTAMAKAAFVSGTNLAMLVGVGTAAAGAVVVLLLPNRSRSPRRSS